MRCCGRRRFSQLRFRRRFFETGDEGFFERIFAARLDQRVRRVAGQYFARVHERDAIAAFRFVHEMRRDKNGDAFLTREVDQKLPELIARHRIDTGRGLVKEQHLRFVNHCDSQRQALPNSEWHGLRQIVEIIAEPESFDQFRDAFFYFFGRHMIELRMELEVLHERELGIKGKVLRHETDTIACLEVVRVELSAKQFRCAFGRRREASEHAHRRSLAGPVRSEETKDLAALDTKAHVIDRGELAEPFR